MEEIGEEIGNAERKGKGLAQSMTDKP